MLFNKVFKNIYFSIFLGLLATGCSKVTGPPAPVDPVTPPPGQQEVVITSLSVNHGSYNQSVVIKGSGFNKELSANKVSFNNKEAVITAASSTQLTVNIPLSAGTGKVIVTNGAKSATVPSFTYDYTFMTTVLAGNEIAAYKDGSGVDANFNNPNGLAINMNGDVFVADASNNVIRKITKDGIVSTFAGDRNRATKDGKGTNASFNSPKSLAIDKAGNLYVSEVSDIIRKVTPDGEVTTIAGSGIRGFADGNGTEAKFNDIEAIAVNSSGDLFVTDRNNRKIRKITPNGQVSTFYEATAAIGSLTSIAIDNKDDLYFTDTARDLQYLGTSLYVLINSAASSINIFGEGPFVNEACGIAIDKEGNKYITDDGTKVIKINTVGEKTQINSVTSKKAINALQPNAIQVYGSAGIAVDKDGICYIGRSNQIFKIGLQ